MFRKKEDKVKPITQATASQMLANVFDACGAEPNTVPLEVLESYSNYRRERYALQRSVLAILLALFLLMPILFLTPEVVVVASAREPRAVPSLRSPIPASCPCGGFPRC